jgi:hypothetical protein
MKEYFLTYIEIWAPALKPNTEPCRLCFKTKQKLMAYRLWFADETLLILLCQDCHRKTIKKLSFDRAELIAQYNENSVCVQCRKPSDCWFRVRFLLFPVIMYSIDLETAYLVNEKTVFDLSLCPKHTKPLMSVPNFIKYLRGAGDGI